MLKPKKTDPDTPWFNLLRTIEGEDQPVFVQWISSDTKSMLGNEDTAISTTNAAPDVMAWKAQGTNNSDQFVMWGGGVPVLTWLVENGGDTNHYCEQPPCCSSAP